MKNFVNNAGINTKNIANDRVCINTTAPFINITPLKEGILVEPANEAKKGAYLLKMETQSRTRIPPFFCRKYSLNGVKEYEKTENGGFIIKSPVDETPSAYAKGMDLFSEGKPILTKKELIDSFEATSHVRKVNFNFHKRTGAYVRVVMANNKAYMEVFPVESNGNKYPSYQGIRGYIGNSPNASLFYQGEFYYFAQNIKNEVAFFDCFLSYAKIPKKAEIKYSLYSANEGGYIVELADRTCDFDANHIVVSEDMGEDVYLCQECSSKKSVIDDCIEIYKDMSETIQKLREENTKLKRMLDISRIKEIMEIQNAQEGLERDYEFNF